MQKGATKMKSYFLHQHKILKLHLLLVTAVIALALPANITYGGIVVDLLHVETSHYPKIQAYVTVLDDTTLDPVTDLTELNFQIFEDEDPKPKTVKSADFIPVTVYPVAIAQALDYSGSMVKEEAIAPMENGAVNLINQLRTDPADACEIVKFDLYFKVVQEFTTDKDALITAVNSDEWTDYGGTKLYDALYQATGDTSSYIASPEGQGSRGSVVVISDGWDFLQGGGQASNHSLEEVIDLAFNNGIRIFAVGYGDVYEEVLRRLADETGGGYFWAPEPSEFESIFRAIVAEHFGGGYIVSYQTSLTGCDYHDLHIIVTKNSDSGEDTESFYLCPSPPDGGGGGGSLYFGGGGGGGGCSMSNPEGRINIGTPAILVGIFALALLVWRKRRRR
jgi:VWFA-related protein